MVPLSFKSLGFYVDFQICFIIIYYAAVVGFVWGFFFHFSIDSIELWSVEEINSEIYRTS